MRRADRETWRNSKQLTQHGPDVVHFEGLRAVPTILLFLTLQEDESKEQRQRDAGGGRYKRLMDTVGECRLALHGRSRVAPRLNIHSKLRLDWAGLG